jgi:hypothetical protein
LRYFDGEPARACGLGKSVDIKIFNITAELQIAVKCGAKNFGRVCINELELGIHSSKFPLL